MVWSGQRGVNPPHDGMQSAKTAAPGAGSKWAPHITASAAALRDFVRSPGFARTSHGVFRAFDRARSFSSRSRHELRTAVERVRPLIFSGRPRRSVVAFNQQRSEVINFLASCRQAFWGLAVFSGLSNL